MRARIAIAYEAAFAPSSSPEYASFPSQIQITRRVGTVSLIMLA